MSKDSFEVVDQPAALKTSKLPLLNKLQAKKDFGSPWQVIFFTILIFIVSQLVATILVELIRSIMGVSPNSDFSNSAPADFFYVAMAEGLAVWLVFLLIKHRGLKPSAIGLGRLPKWSDLGKAGLGFVAFYIVLIVVTGLLGIIDPSINSEKAQDVGFNSLNTHLDGLLAFLALVILPPLGEETLVRGYLYSGLRSKWRFVPAMLVTSLLFGAAHLELGSGSAALWGAAAATFTLSIVLVYLRETTGALYAGMLVHGLNNLIAFGVHFHV